GRGPGIGLHHQLAAGGDRNLEVLVVGAAGGRRGDLAPAARGRLVQADLEFLRDVLELRLAADEDFGTGPLVCRRIDAVDRDDPGIVVPDVSVQLDSGLRRGDVDLHRLVLAEVCRRVER